MLSFVCVDNKSCILCLNNEWPTTYYIILGIYVIQLHNLAVALRHIMSKNISTKECPASYSLYHYFSNSGTRKKNAQNQEFQEFFKNFKTMCRLSFTKQRNRPGLLLC